jgi:hypothetical protein
MEVCNKCSAAQTTCKPNDFRDQSVCNVHVHDVPRRDPKNLHEQRRRDGDISQLPRSRSMDDEISDARAQWGRRNADIRGEHFNGPSFGERLGDSFRYVLHAAELRWIIGRNVYDRITVHRASP